MTLIKGMAIVLAAIVLIGLYAVLVVKSHADRVELEYWRDKARKEGRERGKAEEA